MKQRTPPKIALWIVERYGSAYERESLAGDLIEQFQQGESRWWFWTQVLIAILIAGMARVRAVWLRQMLRLILGISVEAGVMLALCVIVDQPRHTPAAEAMFTPAFMTTIAVLAAAVVSACSLLIWMSRRKDATRSIAKVVAAVAALMLGFGALTWAATTKTDGCRSDSHVCAKHPVDRE